MIKKYENKMLTTLENKGITIIVVDEQTKRMSDEKIQQWIPNGNFTNEAKEKRTMARLMAGKEPLAGDKLKENND